jgi:monoamine oxidase
MADTVPLDSPWSAARALEWDRQTVRGWLDAQVADTHAHTFLGLCAEITLAADAHEASLLHFLFMLKIVLGTRSHSMSRT